MRDEDELWKEIVENYGDRATLDDPPDASEESAPEESASNESPHHFEPLPLADPEPEEPVELRDTWEDEDRFVPEPPPRIPLPEPPRMMAWTGVFGMPLLLLVAVVSGTWLPGWISMGMVVWFVGGFIYLVKTMPDEPRDPWDNGARL